MTQTLALAKTGVGRDYDNIFRFAHTCLVLEFVAGSNVCTSMSSYSIIMYGRILERCISLHHSLTDLLYNHLTCFTATVRN